METARTKILVREVMNGPVISAAPIDSVAEIAKKMVESKVGSVVIIDGEKPVGIVTDGDIVQKIVVKDLKPSSVKAKDIMSQPIHTIQADKDVSDAARSLRRLGIKRLGVTHRERLVGIISMSDVISVTPELMELLSEKRRIGSWQTQRRSTKISGYCDSCNQWSDGLTEIDDRYICEDCSAGARREKESEAEAQP
ncbi:MAG: CBS domain-containing protein [Thaumarchaeota archaeon]|nr:CBS domain-containing protein [Nitrososphaerota archaeon]